MDFKEQKLPNNPDENDRNSGNPSNIGLRSGVGKDPGTPQTQQLLSQKKPRNNMVVIMSMTVMLALMAALTVFHIAQILALNRRLDILETRINDKNSKQDELVKSSCHGDIVSASISQINDALREGMMMRMHPVRHKRQVSSNFSVCCEYLSAPAFVTGGPDASVVAVTGANITLPCDVIGLPTPRINWLNTDPMRMSETSAGLHIDTVVSSDEKNYQCSAANIFGSIVRTIQLIVTEPVIPVVQPNNQTTIEGQGQSATFVCSFTGKPEPRITWFKRHSNGSRTVLPGTSHVTGNNTYSTLTITDTSAGDAGIYVCTASNAYDSNQQRAILDVHFIPRITDGPQSAKVQLGANITMICVVEGNPRPVITWSYPQSTHGVRPFNAAQMSDGSIFIQNVADPRNSGQYVCNATNYLGSVHMYGLIEVVSTVTVTIRNPLHAYAAPLQFISIDCSATGDPNPSIMWRKVDGRLLAGEVLIMQSGSLIITTLQDEDIGVYVCMARNRFSSAEEYAVVYHDLGDADCSTTFEACSLRIGYACRANCVQSCNTAVYGNGTYTPSSAICSTGIHSGRIHSTGDVIWRVTHGQASYVASTNNGITSQSSGTASATIIILTNV